MPSLTINALSRPPGRLPPLPPFLYHHLIINTYHDACNNPPGLTQSLAFLRPSDGQMGWKRDRLGRSLPHLIEIVNGLKTAGVGFRALTEPMDIATPHGELLFHLFGALAQYERALTQERIRAGLAAARRGGAAG